MRNMALKGGSQHMEQYNTATSSQTETCEDNTWFSSDITMLCGSSGGSGGRNYLAHTVSSEESGMDVIQHGQDEAKTDSHLSTFAIPRVRSDLESHSCQYPGCSIDQALNNFECQPVICWFTCAPSPEFLNTILQARPAGCSEHARNSLRTRAFRQDAEHSCLQLHGGPPTGQDTPEVESSTMFESCSSIKDGIPHAPTSGLGSVPAIIPQRQFKCSHPGCESSFKRKEALKRHLTVHSGERPYVCWVPGCQRGFSRRDNLSAHHTSHGKYGGLNRYVATLDKTSPIYDPHYCGQLTPQGWPIGHTGHNSW
ncbi:hypothetical protein N7448_011254 [Penicillium atrosanguineum]|nr:hypothetical protein N7448_011254 [Penicillium atrosanguineum]